MKALVLSGGGALGSYEAGVIQGLHAAGGPPFDMVCGTSIGALNAAFVASNLFDELADTWHTIAAANVITLDPVILKLRSVAGDIMGILHDPVLRRFSDLAKAVEEFRSIGSIPALMALMGAVSPTPIEGVLAKRLDYKKIASRLIVSATDLTYGRSDAFYALPDTEQPVFAQNYDKGASHLLNEENFLSAVRASAAIPFAFAPVAIPTNGTPCDYVDGGVANNTPIGLAIDAGATDITVIFLDPESTLKPQTMANLKDVGMACFGIMQQKILNQDLQNAQRVNENIRNHAGGTGSTNQARKTITLRQVRPKNPLPISVLQFDRQDLIDQAYALGVADAGNSEDVS